jgi:hypothetical protein
MVGTKMTEFVPKLFRRREEGREGFCPANLELRIKGPLDEYLSTILGSASRCRIIILF